MDCSISVDGTDFTITEPTPFSPIWFSHKTNGPAIRYEVALSVRSARIVWTYGPFPAGTPDLEIFRSRLKTKLETADEFAVCDSGYADGRCIQPPGQTNIMHATFMRIRARHESLNGRLKQFGVLGNRYRHELGKHRLCFIAVANITNLMLYDDPLFNL